MKKKPLSFFSFPTGDLDYELEWVGDSASMSIYKDEGKWHAIFTMAECQFEEELESIEDWIRALKWIDTLG